MEKAAKVVRHILNIAIAFSLALMSILVFGNVVLRYAFNSGITWSEEMARFLFIWMVFLGAIVALKENEHLGVDMLVRKLSARWKKVVYVISNLLILYTLWLVLEGSWGMTQLNMDSSAPATGLPLSFIYGIGIVMSVGMGIIVLRNLYQAVFGNKSGDELIMTRESEDLPADRPDSQGGTT
ncbi:TRAP transporter small permease [Lihuaxuella thermophila]|uniref:TRAP-type C4-dicarboxylate transport system, small permease component n=1 Tax=Lihuaxuella thermophila TaxID=1173111 RepID=A0A1H8J8W7_9BACL|nr:TRAP transporter small permease [Lihuaxuella thermophila]SEN76647.1 TRAP-type C4-dicarboxylate transport system, small permease component [Lihuaxuella thermophila]